MDEYAIGVLTNIGLLSFVALSAYLLLVAGELSFGQQAFFGVGAYAAGIGTAMLGWPLPLAALAALACGALAAALDDAIEIRLGRSRSDVFGEMGTDPGRGWMGNGAGPPRRRPDRHSPAAPWRRPDGSTTPG